MKINHIYRCTVLILLEVYGCSHNLVCYIAEPREAPTVPIMLTRKERKKIRTQRRREAEKEKQEKIRLGLVPPPPPKGINLTRLLTMLDTCIVPDHSPRGSQRVLKCLDFP